MKSSILYTVICTIATSTLVVSQSYSISNAINSFGINLLKETVDEAGNQVNVAISPYTIWTLMTVMAEGAQGNTLRELQTTLGLPRDKKTVWNSYQNLTKYLSSRSNAVSIDHNMAIFHNKEFQVKKSFDDISRTVYQVDVMPEDFTHPKNAVSSINTYVSRATRNRIPKLVGTEDVLNAYVFLTSILFFKGLWTSPFNKSATHNETFFDDKNNKIGDVRMMFQIGVFPYARIEDIGSYAVELPYGDDKRMSLILILPFKGESVSGVLNLIAQKPFSSIMETLENSEKDFSDEDIYLYVPKFKIASDFNLNVVLNKIGIKDLFNIADANLLGMFDHYLYVSRLIQKAQIDVDEEGTVASAAAGASFPNKSVPPKFRANRPFLYFIVNKPSRTIIFAGQVTNPNNFK